MKSMSDRPTSIQDRFFIGGPLSVRGFHMRGIGPRSTGELLLYQCFQLVLYRSKFVLVSAGFNWFQVIVLWWTSLCEIQNLFVFLA